MRRTAHQSALSTYTVSDGDTCLEISFDVILGKPPIKTEIRDGRDFLVEKM